MADQHDESDEQHPPAGFGYPSVPGSGVHPVERRARDRRVKVGSLAAGSAIGAAVAGPASAYLARRETFELVEWLGTHGFQGFLLFCLIVLTGFTVWCMREIRRLDDARRTDEVSHRADSQGLLREQIAILPKLVAAMETDNALKRRVTRALERIGDMVEIEETPPDGTPTGSKP